MCAWFANQSNQRSTAAYRIGNTILRACGIAVIGWTLWNVLTSGFWDFEKSQRDVIDAAQASAGNDQRLTKPIFPTLSSGQWSVGTTALTTEAITVRIEELNSVLGEWKKTDAAAEVDQETREMVDLLQQVLTSRRQHGMVNEWYLDNPNLRIHVFADGAGERQRLLGGYVAYPRDAESWTVLRITYSPSRLQQFHRTPTLLSGFSTSDRMAARFDEQGNVQCELLSVPACEPGELIPVLQRDGWTTRSGPGINDGSSVLCSRGSETLHVLLHGRPWQDRGTLIVVRTDRVVHDHVTFF